LWSFLLPQINNIDFDTDPATPTTPAVAADDAAADGATAKAIVVRCPIQLQKETPSGLVDTVCNGDVADTHAGLCR